eukprot:TRINITY_DN3105_c0_g2_i2.p1 TRINITY_DN3105_c0_g2~~TRINITY_DN3105_c0_g2_i2.p1  ORF type:complete len:223 (-),score=63.97 TRINITY_DN3105_c0_g2_i2:40-708(-)
MLSPTSFGRLQKFRRNVACLQDRPAELIPMVLVAHKADLAAERCVSTAEGIQLAHEWGVPYFETSALTGQNVCEVFEALGQEIDRIDALRVINSCKKAVPMQFTTTPHGSTYTGNTLVSTATTPSNNNSSITEDNNSGSGAAGEEVLNPHTQGQVVYAVKDNPIVQSYDGRWCCGRKDGSGIAVLRSNNIPNQDSNSNSNSSNNNNDVVVSGVWRLGRLVQI